MQLHLHFSFLLEMLVVALFSMVIWQQNVVSEAAVPVAKLDTGCRMMNLVAAAALASVRREPAPLGKLALAKLAAADSGRRMLKLVAAAASVRREAAPVAKLDSECRMVKLVAGAAAAPVRPEAAPVAKLAVVANASPVARAAVGKLVGRDTAPVTKVAAKLAEGAVAKFAVAKFALTKEIAVLDVAIVAGRAVAPPAMQHSSPANKLT